jgi:hypothetical protein
MLGATPAENTSPQGGSQANEGWSTEATKKRKLQAPGRPLGAVSKTKTINRDANQSIFSFTGQSQRSTRGASEAPASTQPIENSQMDYDLTSGTATAIGEA